MQVYRVKNNPFAGTDFKEVHKQARSFYDRIKKRTKRSPYVRSAYFKKSKIFLGIFWHHLYEKKNFRDQIRRMKFFKCGIELIQNSTFSPLSKDNPNHLSETLHRFYGIASNGDVFCVQIKEEKRSNKKYLISIFPEKNPEQMKKTLR